MFKTIKWVSTKGQTCETVMHISKLAPLVQELENRGITVQIS